MLIAACHLLSGSRSMQFRHNMQRTGRRTIALSKGTKRDCAGVTLVEVVLSMAIVAMSIGGIMSVYTQAAVNAEWSAHSLAAHMMAISGMEQARAAKYDPRGGTDELVATNFPVRVD